ncbi:MAG: protein kinase [Blastocatellia bacterium]|nr:protein kinase [Blastocatellia bacterium]
MKKLGEGGMGEVYLAEDNQLGRKVALKVLPQSLSADLDRVRRFKQEARAVSALNHPNILTIFEIGEIDNTHFIVTEFIEGESLRERIADEKFSCREAIEICIQVGEALSAAHAAGITHRDIKPENVMLRRDGYVKVLDFGLAKLAEKPHPFAHHTAATRFETDAGVVMGTTHYMSPEQARGLKVDGRSDIFSLGIVMYEMLAGTAPFDGETPSDVMVAILDREPTPIASTLPDIHPELERILSKMLRKNAAERYQTALDLVVDLKNLRRQIDFEVELERSMSDERARLLTSDERISRSVPPVASSPDLPPPTSSFSRLQRFALAAILLFVLVSGGLGYVVFVRKGKPPEGLQGRTLAILPFHNLKPDPETNFLGFSLADAVITKLGYVRELTVRPSSAVDRYRNQMADPQKVGTELSVNTVLTGSYLKDGNDLRITAQLVDVEKNSILWRDTLDLKYEKLLTVQDRVAEEIVKGLKLNLSPTETAALRLDVPQNPAAYEYFLRGRDLIASTNYTAAIEMLEKSTELDPHYALAWAQLGRAYNANATRTFGGKEYYSRAQAAYDKALAINSENPEIRVYYAPLLTETNRVEEAIPLLRNVVKMAPNNARAHWELSYAYRYAGFLPESIAEGELAINIDPRLRNAIYNYYLYDGQYEKFLKGLRDRTDAPIFVFYDGLANLYLKNRARAIISFDRAYQMDSQVVFAQIGKAISYGLEGNAKAGVELLRETEHQIAQRGVSDGETLYKAAQAYAVLNEKPSALRMLRLTIENGFFCVPYFENDELLNSIRNEAEFKSLLAKAKERHLDFKRRFF